MTRTTLQNSTGGVVVLREGQAQVFRKVCDILANHGYPVPSELNQTYKRYVVSSSDGSSQFTLSSDDLSEWREIVIRPSATDPNQFEWKGTIPRSRYFPVQDTGTTSSGPDHHSLQSKVVNKIRGWWFSMTRAETGTTTITPAPAVAITAVSTDPVTGATTITANSAAASSAPATAAPVTGATTVTANSAAASSAPATAAPVTGATTITANSAAASSAPATADPVTGATTITANSAAASSAPAAADPVTGATTITANSAAASSAPATAAPATGTTTAN